MIERMNFKQQIFTLIDFEPKKPGVFLDFGLKVNVNAGQNKFEVHISTNLPKMAINWHKIGQMPLWSFFIQFSRFFLNACFLNDKSNGDNN